MASEEVGLLARDLARAHDSLIRIEEMLAWLIRVQTGEPMVVNYGRRLAGESDALRSFYGRRRGGEVPNACACGIPSSHTVWLAADVNYPAKRLCCGPGEEWRDPTKTILHQVVCF
jgi:hypothetical protein